MSEVGQLSQIPLDNDPKARVVTAEEKGDIQHLDEYQEELKQAGLTHDTVGKAILEQRHVIPTSGERIPTSKWEYITFCIFVSRTLTWRSDHRVDGILVLFA